MAGDWIKVEHVTIDKPEIFAIAERLGIDPNAALGACIRFWIWADQQCADHHTLRVSETTIERVTGCADFAKALAQVGWLIGKSGAYSVPHFARHNGNTAKTRALAQDRMKQKRYANVTRAAQQEANKRYANVTRAAQQEANQRTADNSRADNSREEKRREEQRRAEKSRAETTGCSAAAKKSRRARDCKPAVSVLDGPALLRTLYRDATVVERLWKSAGQDSQRVRDAFDAAATLRAAGKLKRTPAAYVRAYLERGYGLSVDFVTEAPARA